MDDKKGHVFPAHSRALNERWAVGQNQTQGAWKDRCSEKEAVRERRCEVKQKPKEIAKELFDENTNFLLAFEARKRAGVHEKKGLTSPLTPATLVFPLGSAFLGQIAPMLAISSHAVLPADLRAGTRNLV